MTDNSPEAQLEVLKAEIYKVLHPSDDLVTGYMIEFEVITLLLKKNESMRKWVDIAFNDGHKKNDKIMELYNENQLLKETCKCRKEING